MLWASYSQSLTTICLDIVVKKRLKKRFKMNSSVCLKMHESKHYLTINIVNIVT